MSVASLIKRFAFLSVACSAPVGFGGCGLGPHENADSENISITPESTGQITIASLGEQDSLTGTLTTAGAGIDALSLNNEFSITAASTLGKQGLGKIRSTTASPIMDLTDTAAGKARLIFIAQTALMSSYDTVTIRWDDVARDARNPNKNIISASGENVYPGGKIERYNISDLDGDGVVAGAAQYNGKARFTYQAIQGATVESLVMDVSAGADKNFDTDADNKIVSLSWVKSQSGEIIGRATFSDADNDGVLIDNAATAPSTIDVTLFEKNPPFKPFVDSLSLTMRILTDGNKNNDEIIRLSGKEYRIGGGIVTLTVTDVHGNVDVMPFDTAIATFSGSPALQGGWRDSVRFVFDVQSGLQTSSDNLLYELHIRKEQQSGIIKSRTFDFTTTQPISAGQKPKSGHVEATVTYGNDKTASLSADFTETGFVGTWTGPNGNTLTITWDANGNVVSQN